MNQEYDHTPVLLNEVIKYLQPQPNQNFIDGTLGNGGHAEAILQKNGPEGKLLGIDQDPAAIKIAKKRLAPFGSRVIFAQENFKNINKIIYAYNFNCPINGILLDLGLSSTQLKEQSRGFSFQASGPLDMRMSSDGSLSAETIINKWNLRKLENIFKEYGEEKLARPIAQEILRTRKKQPVKTTEQLTEIIKKVYQRFYRKKSKKHPATKVFQALRIAVNDELVNLQEILDGVVSLLVPGGRLAVIGYHSLEDRIVKNYFKKESKDCLCPASVPACQCVHKASLKVITKKPVVPTAGEITDNSRARSAKLRVAERVTGE